MLRILLLASIASISGPVLADFPQFRGPNGNGVIPSANPPTTWSENTNLAWSAKLPGTGWSQPVIIGKTVFLTAAVSEKLAKPKDMQAGVKDASSIPIPGFGPKPLDARIDWQILAIDADTGAKRWAKTVVAAKPQFPIHPSNTYATETVCGDAERVYIYLGATGTLAAFDHAGNTIWKKELGAFPFSNGFGSGSSPALFEDKIYIANFNEKQGSLTAFDTKTGNQIWQQLRDKPGSAWATPFVWRNSVRTEIVACGDKLVTSHDPQTGVEFWRMGGIDTGFAPSPASEGDLLIMGASSPFSASPLFSVKAGAKGTITLKKGETSNEFVGWFRNKGGVGMSSPLAVQGHLYIPSDNSLICVDTNTGVQKYKERLPKFRMVTASPVAVGDKMLLLDETGKSTWVKLGPTFEIIDTAELKDTFWASPAVVGDRVYLRGLETLYCLRKP